MSHPPALPLLDNLFKLINFFCHCFARGVGGLICSALIEEKALAGTAIGPEPTEARNQPPGILSLCASSRFWRRDNFVPPPCFVRWPQLPSHGSRCCHSRHKQSEYRAHPSTDCPLRNYASSVTLSRGRGGAGGDRQICDCAQNAGPWAPAGPILSVSAPQRGSGGATCLKRDVRALSSNIHSY